MLIYSELRGNSVRIESSPNMEGLKEACNTLTHFKGQKMRENRVNVLTRRGLREMRRNQEPNADVSTSSSKFTGDNLQAMEEKVGNSSSSSTEAGPQRKSARIAQVRAQKS